MLRWTIPTDHDVTSGYLFGQNTEVVGNGEDVAAPYVLRGHLDPEPAAYGDTSAPAWRVASPACAIAMSPTTACAGNDPSRRCSVAKLPALTESTSDYRESGLLVRGIGRRGRGFGSRTDEVPSCAVEHAVPMLHVAGHDTNPALRLCASMRVRERHRACYSRPFCLCAQGAKRFLDAHARWRPVASAVPNCQVLPRAARRYRPLRSHGLANRRSSGRLARVFPEHW